MKYQLIIFDCDGTLIDSEELNNNAVSKALNLLGYKDYTLEYCLKRFTGRSFKDIYKSVNESYSGELDKKEFGELIEKYSRDNVTKVKAVRNAKILLEQININIAVASNGHREFVIKYLSNTELIKYFNKNNIFTHDMVNRPKPYPDLFLYAAHQNKTEPKYTLVVEDSEAGVRGAKAAGMYVVGFIGTSFDQEARKIKLKDAGADLIITDLLELIPLINKCAVK